MLDNPKLLISVVRRSRADRVVELAREAGAAGSTTIYGKGTARNKFLRLLCLADVEKELVFTVAPVAVMQKIREVLRTAPDLCVKAPGIGIIIDVQTMVRLGLSQQVYVQAQPGDAEKMEKKQERSLLFIVVNSGLADELIDVARQAGAKGGTVLRARGTVREGDNSFFGITIVPQKEILLILVEKEDEARISDSIKGALANEPPGVGIIFSVPVEDFFALGLKANS